VACAWVVLAHERRGTDRQAQGHAAMLSSLPLPLSSRVLRYTISLATLLLSAAHVERANIASSAMTEQRAPVRGAPVEFAKVKFAHHSTCANSTLWMDRDEGDGSFIQSEPPYTRLEGFQGPLEGSAFTFTMNLNESNYFRGDDPTLGPGEGKDEHSSAVWVKTKRTIFVYVPAAYEDGQEAPLLVVLDGPQYMGVLIKLFERPSVSSAGPLPTFIVVSIEDGGANWKGSERNLEYDTLSGRFAAFVSDEILSAVRADPNVRRVFPMLKITSDPNKRAVLGSSSGGAAAMSMAWFRPDLFRRVICYSCSFVDNQDHYLPEARIYPSGAWEYHSDLALVLSGVKRPIRIFTQASEYDAYYDYPSASHFNWVIANERMSAALQKRGYASRFMQSKQAGHVDSRVSESTLADALAWVWKGVECSDSY
jgi:enterochelin esterase family protein